MWLLSMRSNFLPGKMRIIPTIYYLIYEKTHIDAQLLLDTFNAYILLEDAISDSYQSAPFFKAQLKPFLFQM